MSVIYRGESNRHFIRTNEIPRARFFDTGLNEHSPRDWIQRALEREPSKLKRRKTVFPSVVIMSDFRLRAPFSWLMAGGSGYGKTTKCVNFLKYHSDMINSGKCENIIYFYNQWQPQYDDLDRQIRVQWIEGAPTLDQITNLSVVRFSHPFCRVPKMATNPSGASTFPQLNF